MRECKKPYKAANDIIILLDTVFGKDRFPVNIKDFAVDYSKEKFPGSPLTNIQGASLNGFGGALYGKQNKWAILYNDNISEGRLNFTLAHEFGHYLLHRDEESKFECSGQDMVSWQQEYAQREYEANLFASHLLMPPNDFREQVKNQRMSFDLIDHCTNRYNVSLTAAWLKWIEFTDKRAVLLASRDGFVLWSRSSQPAFKSGVYYKTANRPPLPIPENSFVLQNSSDEKKIEGNCPAGVWWKDEEVREMTVCSDKYDIVLTLLLFEGEPPNRWEKDEEEVEDTYDRFMAIS